MSKPNLRSVGYVRTSISSQSPGAVSLFRQQDEIARFCDTNGLQLLEWFEEPNRSGSDEDRQVFGRMIAAATAPDRQFELIVVASASRFSRDPFQFEAYRRRLERAGVELAVVSGAG